METSIIIKSTNSANKSISKSVTNINPNVSDENLYTFAVDFNNISKNSFENATRIDKKQLTSNGGE